MTISLRKHQQRILDRMLTYNKGQIIVPTGGGKTLTMILDTQRRHDVINNGTTTVVVAPRILLAEQDFAVSFWKLLTLPTLTLCTFIVVRLITLAAPRQTRFTCLLMLQELLVRMLSSSPLTILCIVFEEADIEVNTIYFDEAHNSVKKNFFPATEFFAENADRCYFYTATPKHSLTPNKPGMNWSVYGQILENVPAPEDL